MHHNPARPMTDRLKFYLDENVQIVIAEQLKRRDIGAVTAHDLDALGDTDESHLARATEKGYVFCTHDADFVAMASVGTEHGGIVFGQQDQHGIGDWVRGLVRLHTTKSAEEMRNHVEYL